MLFSRRDQGAQPQHVDLPCKVDSSWWLVECGIFAQKPTMVASAHPYKCMMKHGERRTRSSCESQSLGLGSCAGHRSQSPFPIASATVLGLAGDYHEKDTLGADHCFQSSSTDS